MKSRNIIPKEFRGHKLDVSSGWKGLENYIPSIMEEFSVKSGTVLEFGVDLGYSSHIFSQLFDRVIGVDRFEGDAHINHTQDNIFYENILSRFRGTNVKIVKSDFRDFIKNNSNVYDLIHIDIVHLYDETFECAEWAVHHSDVVILHDTLSFPDIHRVCVDISVKYNTGYYNIPEHFGLGVIFR